MLFTSLPFFIFFAITLLMLFILKGKKGQHVYLLLANCFFYGWWDVRFLGLLIVLSLLVYYCGTKIYNAQKAGLKGKEFLLLGVASPLMVLFFFKYFNFFLDNVSGLLSIRNKETLNIILPLGISFYTFQALSYVIEVYQKKVEAEKSIIYVALYIMFFPQLLSGPIMKARNFLPQLKESHKITVSNIQAGIQTFVIGLFKKLVIADYLAIFVNDVYSAPLEYDSATVWLAVISYSLQIYFDFSGYSDMAIGCARCMGYNLVENFNMPYLAKNISEFWKRWHISLSSWLQEYVYFALGGNRKGLYRTYINIMITMVLCGIWHGAAWTFILWGAIHGALQWIHKTYSRLVGKNDIIPVSIKVLMTYLAVTLCWIFFRAENMETIGNIFYRIFVWTDIGISQLFAYSWFAIIVYVTCVYATVKYQQWDAKRPLMNLNQIPGMTIFFVEAMMVIGLMYTGKNPFIYFNF